jgi:hypothetical protein
LLEKIMKPQLLYSTVISLVLSATTLPSLAATPRIDLLGDAAPAAAATRTIVIAPDTKYVNVTGGDIVRFVAGDKSFTWAFNVGANVSSFDLRRVAPPGVLDKTVMAYVAPDPRYIGGGGEKDN